MQNAVSIHGVSAVLQINTRAVQFSEARADVGFAKVFVDSNTRNNKTGWIKNFQELSLGVEIFNIFNNQNAITNTWVRDVYSKNQYAIPNYMTSRVFNIKLNARL